MKRYWVVAQHEFVTQIRRRSFLFMVFILPLVIAGLSTLTGILSARQEEQTGTLGRIGIVDLSGVLAAERNRPSDYETFPNEETAAAALEANQIGAYFVIPDNYIVSGVVQGYAHDPIPGGIENQLRTYLLDNLLADQTPLVMKRLRDPAEVSMATLDGRINVDENTGLIMILTPIIFAVLFILSISMTANIMMQNVVEEKETRMVEMITTSITPLELLRGKIIGLSALGLFQIGVWVLFGGVTILLRQDLAQAITNISYPAWLLVLAFLYLILGYVLYGSLLSGIGASSSSMQEATPIAALFSLMAVVPLWFVAQFLENANGAFPIFLSMLPFTAPTAMVLRLVLGQVPWWQVAASLGLLAISVVVVIWLAAWVFRVGLLMTGQRLSLTALLNAIRQNRDHPGTRTVYEPRRL
ncbi:MAG: ABC transporter permease [Candidatus Promineifilaceae bacterium]